MSTAVSFQGDRRYLVKGPVMSKVNRLAMVHALAGILCIELAGCASFDARPIEPSQAAERLEGRSFEDPSLRSFVETNLRTTDGSQFPSSWNLDSLTLAAFYFQPELDVARAQWAVAQAQGITAGERPGIVAGLSAGRNATTKQPTPNLGAATIDVPLETAGKRGYRISQAAQLSEAARLRIASVAWQLHSRVRSSMLELYGALESEALLKQQQSIHARNVKILEGQYQAGAISAYDLTQGRIAADSARLALRDAERQAAEARAHLATAIGVPAGALDEVRLSFAAFEHLPADPAPAELRRQALLNRPDILAALAEYGASQSALQLEIAKQYPDLQLSPGYEYDQGDDKWSLGLSVTLPADRNRGPIAEAHARRDEAAARFNALQASVLGQIDLALAAYRAASRKLDDASAMLADVKRQVDAGQSMLEIGEISRGDLTLLQVRLGDSALAELDARLKAQDAAGQLEDSIQAQLGLPSAVWEEMPRGSEVTQGAESP
jgi:cobalt-zinc-cadmium efflux system outer membrane protein